MKKKKNFFSWVNIIPWERTCRIMKVLFILLTTTLVSFATGSYSQSKSLTFRLEKVNLIEVFEQIEKQSDMKVAYDISNINVDQRINISVDDASIENVLTKALENTELSYRIFNHYVIISSIDNVLSSNAQQQKNILGKVVDITNSPLPGVSVVVKGTTTGTITDAEGNYTIKNVQPNATLQFSFVGMKSQEIVVGNQTTINVSLLDESIGLQEVIAVGYGTQSKRTVTGSIQTVSADDLKDMPVAQIAQSLQGKTSGVQISQSTGTPGEALKIRVRGSASLNAGNDPLYVVDGFPIQGDLTGINPEEIASITILKDASSTALYGSRGANGVILVETKSGKQPGTKVDVSASYGVQVLPQKGRLDLMNGTEFAQFKLESYLDKGIALADVPAAFQNPAQYGEGTSWYDIMFDPAPVQDYTITLTNNSNKLSTTVVGGYYNQKGIMINSGYDRYSLRINSKLTVSDKLRFGFNLAPSLSNSYSPPTVGPFFGGTNLLYNSILAWPIVKYKNDDGTLPLSAWVPGLGGFPTGNYYRSAQEIKYKNENFRLLSNAYIEVEPIKGLVLKSSVNLQLSYGQTKNWNPSTATMRFASVPPVTNTLYLAGLWESSWLNENTATYNFAVGKHKIDFLAGYTTQKFKSHTISINAQNFPDDRINDLDAAVTINATATNPAGTDETTNEWSMISYLGRANYSYSGKYNLSAVIRRDGSSRFGENNRWGYFPSFSGSWVLSDETFFPKSSLVSLAKLRASWGLTGNNNIGNYTQYALVSLGQNAIVGNSIVSGSRVTNLNNTMLGWEKTGQFNIGFDLGIIKNRIDVGYDYYVKRTTDLLYNFSIPQSSGYASFMGNSGEIKFWGHEISVQSRNLVGKFKWNTNFNITFGDNKVVYLADNVDAIYNGGFGSGHITKVGERVGLFWGMIADGVYDNQAEYDSSPKATQSAVGTIKFKDVNNDGKILNTNTGGDLTVIGDPTPKFMFGMTNTFKYENFDLSITMSGSYGNDINNSFIQGAGNLDGPFNVLKEVKYRWRSPENPGNGKYGTTRYNTGAERDWFSTRFIEDGSYLTIKNITLGYNVNVKKFNYLKSLRVYGSIQQVYTFTKYSGNNPEVSNSTSVLTLGDDMTGYPVPRAWSFGVNVGF